MPSHNPYSSGGGGSGEINTGDDPGGDAYQADDDDDDRGTPGADDNGSNDGTIEGPSGGLAPSGDDEGTLERVDDDRGTPGANDNDSNGDREINTGDPDADVYQAQEGTPQGLEAGQSAFSDQARELEQEAIDRFGGDEEDYVVSAEDDRLRVSMTESAQQDRLEARRESVSRIPGAPGGDAFAQDRDDVSDRIADREQAREDAVQRLPGAQFRSSRADAFSTNQAQSQEQPTDSVTIGDQATNVVSNFFAATPAGQLADTGPGQAVSRGVSGLFDAGDDVRQWQQQTTPLEDFAESNRELFGGPAPGEETATSFGGTAADIRESRLDARSELLEFSDEFASSPAGQAALVTAAAVEPTPVGEALLFGGASAGLAGGAAATGQSQGEQNVPTSPFAGQSEVDVPEDGQFGDTGMDVPTDGSPVTDSELGVPDVGGINRPELQPSESPEFGSAEIPIPDRTQDDLLSVTTAQLFREGRLRERGRDVTDTFREQQGADQDELEQILSGGGTLGEIDQTPEIDYQGENFGLREQPFGTDDAPAVEQPELDVTQTPSLDVTQSPGQAQSPVQTPGFDQPQRVEQTPDLTTQQRQSVDVGLDTPLSMGQGLSLTASTLTTPIETGANVDLDVTETEPTEYGFGTPGPSTRRRRRRLDFSIDSESPTDDFELSGAERQVTFPVADLGFGGDNGNDDSPFTF